MESTKKKRVWHDGPPPHIGWWNASVNRGKHVWRWWNGEAWGLPVSPAGALGYVRHYDPSLPASHQADIQWNDYWPENARVPRMRPEDFETAAPWVNLKTGDRWVVWVHQRVGGEYVRLITLSGRMLEVRTEDMGVEFVPERCYVPEVLPTPGLRRELLVDPGVLTACGVSTPHTLLRKARAGLGNEPCPFAGLPTTAFKEVV